MLLWLGLQALLDVHLGVHSFLHARDDVPLQIGEQLKVLLLAVARRARFLR